MSRSPNVKWTREHFLISLNVYRKLLFGPLHKGNPLIIQVAERMGRTPSSLAMKLSNFASLDPIQKARGIKPIGPTEKTQIIRARRGQQFFRQTVLAAYGIRCAISGIRVPRLLVASHIRPWSSFPNERLNPRNGVCLSIHSIHDAAFDAGLITFNEGGQLILSKHLRCYFPEPALEQNFAAFEWKTIRMPEKVAEPDPMFMEFHRNEIFQS